MSSDTPVRLACAALAAYQPLLHTRDIERVLRAPVLRRSAHFALHALFTPACQGPAQRHEKGSPAQNEARLHSKLSTDRENLLGDAVDKLSPKPFPGLRVASVVPKRHARRAVTRNLIKRQIRHVAAAHAGAWLRCDAVLRLARPFDPKQFVSAASGPLRRAVRTELLALMQGPAPGGPAPKTAP
jgi:ribonuclease P protein component